MQLVPRLLPVGALLFLLVHPVLGSQVSWEAIGQGGGTNYTRLAIDPNDPYLLYIAADVGGPWRSRDRGLSWELLGHKPGLEHAFHQFQDWAFSPSGSAPTTVVGATVKGIMRSTDGGESWENLTNQSLTQGKFFKSCDGSQTTTDDIDERLVSIAIHPSSPDIMYAGTGSYIGGSPSNQDTRIYKTVDGGDTWELVANGILVEGCTTTNFSANANVFSLLIHPDDPTIVYASTDQGVWMSVDSGDTWDRIDATLPTYDICDPTTPGRVHARHMDLHWNASTSTTTLYVALVGTGGFWTTEVAPPDDPRLVSAYAWNSTTDPFNALATDCDQMSLTFPQLSCTSTSHRIAVDPTDADIVIANVNDGGGETHVFRSTDGGLNWLRVSDDREAGLELERWEHYCPYFNFGRIWGIEFDPTDSNIVYWFGGTLYRSTDGGVGWGQISSEQVGTGKAMACDFVSGSDLAFPCPPANRGQWFGRSNQGTWSYAIAVDPVDPGTFFIGNADNFFWRMESGNSGLLITNETDGLQGGQVQTLLVGPPPQNDLFATHAYHSSNSKEGLWVGRSQNGGDTFDDFSEGLPGSGDLCHPTETYATCLYDNQTVTNPCTVLTEKRVRYPLVLDTSTDTLYLGRPGWAGTGVPGFGIFQRPLDGSQPWTGLDPACWNATCTLPPTQQCTKWPNPNINSLVHASGALWAGGDGFISRSDDAGVSWALIQPKDAIPQDNGVTGRVETMAIQDQGDANPDNDVIWAAVSEFRSDAALMPMCGASSCVRDSRLLRIAKNGSVWESEMVLDAGLQNLFDGLSQVRVVVVDPANPERLYVGATSAASSPVAGNLPGLYFTDDPTNPPWGFESLPHATIETLLVNAHDTRQVYVGTRGGGAYRVTFRDTDDDGEPDWVDDDDDGDLENDASDCAPLEACGNGTCASTEDCGCCPADCIAGPSCGDGICDASTEDCNNCPGDCFEASTGPPPRCCGEGSGEGCKNSGCNSGGFQCTETTPASFCCGDDVCASLEDATNCAVDCGCASDTECDDSNDCTVDSCVSGVCANIAEPDEISCVGGVCCAGSCVAPTCSSHADCDDQDACSTDTCVNWGTCTAACDNAFPGCGPADGCCGASCTPATDPDCSCLGPGAACTDDPECCSNNCKGNGTCK